MPDVFDFQTFSRSRRPNDAFCAPAGFAGAASADMESPVFPVPAARLFEGLLNVLSGDRQYTLCGTDPTALRVTAVATTRLLKFRDDLDMAVLRESEAASSLLVYSRSRIGYSDFGANRKRVTQLLKAVSLEISP